MAFEGFVGAFGIPREPHIVVRYLHETRRIIDSLPFHLKRRLAAMTWVAMELKVSGEGSTSAYVPLIYLAFFPTAPSITTAFPWLDSASLSAAAPSLLLTPTRLLLVCASVDTGESAVAGFSLTSLACAASLLFQAVGWASSGQG